MYKGFWLNQNPQFMYLNNLDHWWGGIFISLAIWSLFWKGLALWRAAKLDSKGWFVALLLINTAGILDIIYLAVSGSKKSSKKK